MAKKALALLLALVLALSLLPMAVFAADEVSEEKTQETVEEAVKEEIQEETKEEAQAEAKANVLEAPAPAETPKLWSYSNSFVQKTLYNEIVKALGVTPSNTKIYITGGTYTLKDVSQKIASQAAPTRER